MKKRIISNFEKFKLLSRMNVFISDYGKKYVCELYTTPGGYHVQFETRSMVQAYKMYKERSDYYDSRISPDYVELLKNYKK